MAAGIFFLGYALFAVPSTFVCAWVGAPRFLGGILVAWGCVATLFSCMRSQWQFYMLRFILGLAESGAYPGGVSPVPQPGSEGRPVLWKFPTACRLFVLCESRRGSYAVGAQLPCSFSALVGAAFAA